ncbi:unnamed protein product [Adineta steineri]|uniref:Sphingomyelin phosphodiesterase 4 n=1 Tax=Adineta steineri TaxID=433720 RepID=A0A814MGP0_9BILA|nr:unnamed protein product [Adineta steineri]CAF3506961.1 unnamed protein product [Adineta steineri]
MFTRPSLVSILDLGPIDACIQLSSQFPRMTVQELHVELPYVIRRIFGFGRFDWSLRDIGNDRPNLFSIIQEFLSPWHGELWKAIVRLQDHTPQFTFQFNISDLPIHLRAKLASLCLPDIVRGRTTATGQHLTSLALDPIEYFLFYLLSYVVSDQHSTERPMRSDSVYLNILEMYLCLFLPIDADEFRLLLMPTNNNNTNSNTLTTSHIVDPRLSPPVSVEAIPKKSPIRQSYLFGSSLKQRGDGEGTNMNMSTSPTSSLLPSSPPVVLSTTTADTNELMKKIDYFIKCYVAFLIDVFQPSKSVFGTNSGSILVQEFNLPDVHLLCIRMFIKRLHLFCSYQIGIGGNNTSLANTGMTLLEQRNLLVPLQTLKRTCIDTYVRQPLYTLLQIGIVRCPLDQRYNTLLFVWYTYIRPWRFSPQTISNDHKATSLLDTTTNDQDISSQDQSIINTETINFVEHNLPFYGRLFQFAVDRLQKTDLTNGLIAQLITKLANVFSSKNFSSLLLKAEQVAMFSQSSSYSPNKQRISPPSSPNGPRPAYSILCDETRTIMLGCLRKISCVIQKNERRIEENNRITEQEKQRLSQATQIVSTNARELLKRLLYKIPYITPSESLTKTIQLKPLLPTDIVEQLTNTKNKFMELFQIDPNIFDTTINEDEPSLTHSLNTTFPIKCQSLSTSITESSLNVSYSPYELENPILSPPNPFELRPLLWFNRQLSENINLRYADKINSLYNLQGFLGAFFRQLFYGPNDQRFHSIRTPQINFRHFTDIRTLLVLLIIYVFLRFTIGGNNLPLNILLLTMVILIWNIFRTIQTYRQSLTSL